MAKPKMYGIKKPCIPNNRTKTAFGKKKRKKR